MKGYSYQDETARKVGMEAMQNGITGGGGGAGGSAASGIGEVAGLGVALGAMGGVINMTRDALNPIMGTSTQVGQGFGGVIAGTPGAAAPGAPVAGAPVAGAPVAPVAAPAAPGAPVAPVAGAPVAPVAAPADPAAPVAPAAPVDSAAPAAPAAPVAAPASLVVDAWNCANCGKAGITSRFCPDCGTPYAPKS